MTKPLMFWHLGDGDIVAANNERHMRKVYADYHGEPIHRSVSPQLMDRDEDIEVCYPTDEDSPFTVKVRELSDEPRFLPAYS